MHATNLPSARSAMNPGAVPCGLSSTTHPSGRYACRRLLSLIVRPNERERSSIARSDGSEHGGQTIGVVADGVLRVHVDAVVGQRTRDVHAVGIDELPEQDLGADG